MKSASNLSPTTLSSSLLRRWKRWRFSYPPPALLLGVGLWLVFFFFLFYPVAFMLQGAIIYRGEVTLQFFALLFRDPLFADALKASFGLATVTTVLTLIIAVPIAFVMGRYRLPLKGLLNLLLLAPFILPPFVGAIAVRQLLARYGPLNQILIKLRLIDPLSPPAWLDYPFWGVIILQVFHFLPIAYLNVIAALSRVDLSLEEAARSLGAHGFRLFRTITLPLIVPGLFAGASLVFILAFTDLGTPLIFNYDRVVSVRIFHMVETALENPPGYALVLVVMVASVFVFWVGKSWAERWKVEIFPPRRAGIEERTLPPPLAWGISLVIFLILCIALLPHLTVILNALADRWVMTPLPDRWTLRHFKALWEHPLTFTSIRNSLLYSLTSASLDILLGLTIAYLVVRRKVPFPEGLDGVAMAPLAIPGIVIAFGYVGAFAGTPLDPRVNPVPLLIVAYAIRRLPYMVRACYAGLRQASEALEEAAVNLGASPLRTFITVTLPQIAPHLLAGGIMAFAFAMLEVSDSLILAFDQGFYPITKAIYALSNRIGDGPRVASAMGVLGMFVLGSSFVLAARLMGRRMGEVFQV